MTAIPTSERLARAIEEAAAAQNRLPPLMMISRARAGYYDDFGSDLADPIIQVVQDLRAATAAGYYDFSTLVDLAMRGEFDSTKEEGDAWAASPEGQATVAEFFRRPSPPGPAAP